MDSHLKEWIKVAIKEGYTFYRDDQKTLMADVESILKKLDRPEGIWVQSPKKRLKIELPVLFAEESDYFG